MSTIKPEATKLKQYLMHMVQNKASDLYIGTGIIPTVKINGIMSAIPQQGEESPIEVESMIDALLTLQQKATFMVQKEMNVGFQLENVGRFRVNIFEQRGRFGLVLRSIPDKIPTLDELGLPPILKKLAAEPRGLVLVVGATGTGKSTTLAAMIDCINEQFAKHIITVEDPIEFYYQNKKSIVNQREVGIDTLSFEEALKNTLRQAPDVILIGEIRDRETMESAIKFTETGHLCFSTIHATSANQAIERIINLFPRGRRDEILFNLSLNVKSIISQRLLPNLEGKRCAALEILLATPLVCELIKRGEITGLKEIMERSENLGMQTNDAAIVNLVKQKKIDQKTAENYADSPNNVRLALKSAASVPSSSRLSLQSAKDEKPESINPWKTQDE